MIASSDNVSGFSNTGVPEDEGQHLQSLFEPAINFGGPGKFAFDENAQLNETSELISEPNRLHLLNEWGKYWDPKKPVLIEKSPPNLLRMKFLQQMFPGAYFITIIRHPLAVSLATKKWSRTSLHNLMKHWLMAHRIHENDQAHIHNHLIVSYEYLAENPRIVIEQIESFLDIEIDYQEQFVNQNQKYFDQWKRRGFWNIIQIPLRYLITKAFEGKVHHFGYSLTDLSLHPEIKVTRNN